MATADAAREKNSRGSKLSGKSSSETLNSIKSKWMNKLRINSVPCRTFAGLPNRWTGTRPNDQSGRLVDAPTANREVTGQTYTPNKLSPLPVSDGFVVDGRRRYFEPFPPRRSPQISIHSTKQGKSVVTKCFRIESLLFIKVSTNLPEVSK